MCDAVYKMVAKIVSWCSSSRWYSGLPVRFMCKRWVFTIGPLSLLHSTRSSFDNVSWKPSVCSACTRKASHANKPRRHWHSSCSRRVPMVVKTESVFADGMPRRSMEVSFWFAWRSSASCCSAFPNHLLISASSGAYTSGSPACAAAMRAADVLPVPGGP